MPKRPITFDKTGKFLLYDSISDRTTMKRQYGSAILISFIPQYCLIRAFMRMSWWRILLWSIPSVFFMNTQRNVFMMTSRKITRLYLKEDGETVVIETILSGTMRRKHVVKISHLKKEEDP